jgi:uncharacterized protein (DUF2252 family)
VAELVPLRYSRMAVSPFAFFRGSAIVMASDLAAQPSTGIETQICGDAHIANFGVFASPERNLMFDLNDFDESHRGPFEWDVKRMATSVGLAARAHAYPRKVRRRMVAEAIGVYRAGMRAAAGTGHMAVWYATIPATDVSAVLRQRERVVPLDPAMLAKAHKRTSLRAMEDLTTVVGSDRRFVDDPPLLERCEELGDELVSETFDSYRQSLQDDRRHLLDNYRLVDTARKVVGVGSVGTRCYVGLFQGRDDGDPLLLQVKEAESSVLELHLGASPYANHGERIVAGQRMMQATSDIFLGWGRAEGCDFYWRQLHDMKGSADLEHLADPAHLASYAALCAATLARAHARGGNRLAIAAYLGRGTDFDLAVAEFAETYADLVERDHQALVDAIASGRLTAAA